MAKLSRLRSGYTLLLTFIGTFFVLPPCANGQLQECSLAKTNKSCALLIDRANPVAPSTIQMYSGESVTVVVQNPNGFERYFLDYQSGQATLKPDVASSIVQGLLPSLQKAGEIKALSLGMNPANPPDVCDAIAKMAVPTPGKQVDDTVQVAGICMGQLAEKAIDIYQKLEPLVAPDSLTPAGVTKLKNLASCSTASTPTWIPKSGSRRKLLPLRRTPRSRKPPTRLTMPTRKG